MLSISVSLDITKFPDFWWKNAGFIRTQGVGHMIYIFLWSPLGKRLNWVKFHYCKICVTYFREEAFLQTAPPPIHEQPWKCPSWIGLKKSFFQNSYAITLHLIFWWVVFIYDINLCWNYETILFFNWDEQPLRGMEVIRKEAQKGLQDTENLFRKNLQLKDVC